MDDWKKFRETSILEKEDLFSILNMKDITDADYRHDLCVRSDTVLANIFENF